MMTANQSVGNGIVGGADGNLTDAAEAGMDTTPAGGASVFTPLGDTTMTQEAKDASLQREQNRQIALLLAELDSARDQIDEVRYRKTFQKQMLK